MVLVQTRQTLDLNVTDICKEEWSKFQQDVKDSLPVKLNIFTAPYEKYKLTRIYE